jgi:hypothetical protein
MSYERMEKRATVRARRMVHDAIDSDIVIARMAGASRREGRRERRELPKVRRI